MQVYLLLKNGKNKLKVMIEMPKKKTEGKTVADELHKIWDDFQTKENPVDEEVLTILFKMRKGDIYFNDESNLAVGFYPTPQNLVIYFFEILPNKKLKCVDSRGICITERIEIDLKKAIELCKILEYDKDEEVVDKSYQ